MNLTMISKSLLIALPMLALGACSSTADMDAASAESGTEQAVETAVDTGIQTDTIEAVKLSAEELMVKEYSEAILETTILFDFDNSMIRPEFTPILDAHARYLVANPEKSLTVEGHPMKKEHLNIISH
jgi:peptidoglycan-associated lipoprotein